MKTIEFLNKLRDFPLSISQKLRLKYIMDNSNGKTESTVLTLNGSFSKLTYKGKEYAVRELSDALHYMKNLTVNSTELFGAIKYENNDIKLNYSGTGYVTTINNAVITTKYNNQIDIEFHIRDLGAHVWSYKLTINDNNNALTPSKIYPELPNNPLDIIQQGSIYKIKFALNNEYVCAYSNSGNIHTFTIANEDLYDDIKNFVAVRMNVWVHLLISLDFTSAGIPTGERPICLCYANYNNISDADTNITLLTYLGDKVFKIVINKE